MSSAMAMRVLGCLLGLALLHAVPSEAVKRAVDSDGEATASNCDSSTDTPYTTIAAALDDSGPGDVIVVCPGTGPYNEQLTIGLAVTIQGKAGAVLRPSPMVANSTSLSSGNGIAAAILVSDGVTGVSIQTLIIDGGGNEITGCLPNPIGVYFRNASGSVTNSVVRNFRLGAGLGGCQSGLGIFAQADGIGGTANVTVTGTSVHDFQKNGITGNEEGATLTASGNRVTGDGPTPDIAQNGIQAGFGAMGVITSNFVSEVVYSLCENVSDPDCLNGSSTGVLVFQGASGTGVSKNTIATTQTAVYLDTDNGTAASNLITRSLVYDGIYVPGDGNTVEANTIFNSDEAAVFIDGNSNTVTKNKINEAPVGIFVACGTTGNVVTLIGSGKNTLYNVAETTNSCPPSITAFAGSLGEARAYAAPVR